MPAVVEVPEEARESGADKESSWPSENPLSEEVQVQAHSCKSDAGEVTFEQAEESLY